MVLRVAALAAVSAIASASDLCSLPNNKFVCYKLHPSFLSDVEPDWPSGMPKGAAALSAVGVDPSAPGGAEIYVSQRGGAMKGLEKGPILVFNENGDLIRQFGSNKGGTLPTHDRALPLLACLFVPWPSVVLLF